MTTTKSGFAELGLNAPVVAALKKRGIETPTAIQAQVFAPAAAGRNVLARSRTGSGKTLAFGLPLMGRLDSKIRAPQMLVMTPTRELAVQVAKEMEDVAGLHGLAVAHVIGGASMRDQMRQIKTAQIIVGTPGRLIDHLERRTLILAQARAVVLDEGDEMLDMGFLEDITKILEALPTDAQRLLFSATIPPAMQRVIKNYLRDAVTIETDAAKTAHADITHLFYLVRPADRYAALVNLLLHEQMDRVLVFTQTKNESADVAMRLNDDGFSAAFLNGDLSQDQRTQVMDSFRSGRARLLIATDVAARGIDVQGVSHVVHYTVPGSNEAYTHRSGRTGRAGAAGVSLALVGTFERAKATRLSIVGHFKADWRNLPTQGEIEKANAEKLQIELKEKLAEAPNKSALHVAKKLLTDAEPEAVVAALVQALRKGEHRGYEIHSPVPPKFDRSDREKRPFREDRERPAARFDRSERSEKSRVEKDTRPERSEKPRFVKDTGFVKEERVPAVAARERITPGAFGKAGKPTSRDGETATSFVKSKRAHADEAPAFGKEKRAFRERDAAPPFGGEKRSFKERENGPEKGMDRYRIYLGERQRVNPGVLIQLLCRNSGLEGGDFGRIDVRTNETVFDVKHSAAGKIKKKPSFQFGGKAVEIQPA